MYQYSYQLAYTKSGQATGCWLRANRGVLKHNNGVNLETVECSLRQWSSKFGDGHGCHYWVRLEIHLEAIIERLWRYTWRCWLGELRDQIQASLEMDFKAVKDSISNGSGPSLQVLVRVQTEPLPNCRSGMSINPNRRHRYGSMVNRQPIWIGRVVGGSPSRSIHRFN